jgi:hypothetical protein
MYKYGSLNFPLFLLQNIKIFTLMAYYYHLLFQNPPN